MFFRSAPEQKALLARARQDHDIERIVGLERLDGFEADPPRSRRRRSCAPPAG